VFDFYIFTSTTVPVTVTQNTFDIATVNSVCCVTIYCHCKC